MNKEYIGDSVYVELDDYQLVLTTENGEGPTNEIFLDPEVFKSLVVYTIQYGFVNNLKWVR